jgi:hypothetical protein
MKITVKGLEELQKAVKKFPEKTKELAGKFIVRGLAEYKRTIINNPWRMGMSGGGAPSASGNLAQTHKTQVSPWEGSIFPTAPYAPYVHGIEGFPRKRSYALRPWLDYSVQQNEDKINELQQKLLEDIVAALGV